MAKRERNSGRAVFYKPITDATEIRSGYLYKSPPTKLLKSEWRKRYFVLFKTSEHDYQLRYFRSAEERGTSLGGIDLTLISLLYGNPQHHQKWSWVQKSFKCSPSCVLYIRAGNRDYFLVGETSAEVDSWFSDLFEALKKRPHKFLSSEEISNGQPTADIISNPLLHRRKNSDPEVQKAPFIVKREEDPNNGCQIPLLSPVLKIRSLSDPSSNAVDGNTEEPEEDISKRRASEPVDSIYDYPRSYQKPKFGGNDVAQAISMESLYESMTRFKIVEETHQADDHEVEAVISSTLMRSITHVYAKFKAQSSPLPISEEAPTEDGEDKRQSSDFSSSSSGAISPVDVPETNGLEKQDFSENLDRHTPEQREFMVKQSDLQKHLTLTEAEGKPSVSGWTGQPQSVCLFHKEDQVLAINDLHTGSVEEFYMFLSKSLKNEVKVTILRQRGRQPLHLPNCPCSD